jgi:flagellin-like hook-associated protein FlgL
MAGTTGGELRATQAADLNNILEQLVSLANTQRLGQSLFAGANASDIPYTVERDEDGNISRVIYQGSLEEMKVEIANGVEMSSVICGKDIFSPDSRQDPVYNGDTGAAGGSGTNTVRGDVFLEIQGTAGNWQLSIDGGATWVNSDGTEANLAVVNSETGETLYVNTTGITQTGTEPIQIPGTYDIFNSLICARDLMLNKYDVTEQQLQNMMDANIEEMQVVDQKLTRSFSVVGGRLQTLSALRDSMEEMQSSTTQDISRMQDADITQVAIDLARYEVLYQMSLSVASKLFSMSFLDFME